MNGMLPDNRDARVLVTGGSGFIGTACLLALQKRGIATVSTDIAASKIDAAVRTETVDIRDAAAVAGICTEFRPTHVLHLAAKTGMDLDGLHQLTANTDGVRNVIAAAVASGTVRRVLFTSSLLVCKNGYLPRHDEDYCPPNYYGESKMLGERIVRGAKLPFEWVIVRPTSIWGPWFEHSYRQFFKTIRSGRYVHFPGCDIVKPKSYVGNTAHMMLRLLLDGADVDRKTYYLTDWPESSTRAWAEEINRQMGGAHIRTMPMWAVRVAASMGDLIKRFGADPPISSFRLNNMLTGGCYPYENTRQIVGDLPYTLEVGVRETIAWMKGQRLIR